jgi:hypothetical protein
MRLVHLLVIGAALLTGGSGIVIWRAQRPSSEEASGARRLADAQGDRRPAAGAGRLASRPPAFRKESGPAAAEGAPPGATTAEGAVNLPDVAAVAEKLDLKLRLQRPDPAWQGQLRTRIAADVTNRDIILDRLDCGDTICRARFSHPNLQQRAELGRRLTRAPSPDEELLFHYQGGRTTVYLGRRGDSLLAMGSESEAPP